MYGHGKSETASTSSCVDILRALAHIHMHTCVHACRVYVHALLLIGCDLLILCC